MQTGSSETLIGWKNLEKPLMFLYGAEWRERGYGLWKNHLLYVPLWDPMEGAWLWTQDKQFSQRPESTFYSLD